MFFFFYKTELKYLSGGSTFFRFRIERVIKIRQLAVGCNSLYIGGNIVTLAHLTNFSVLKIPILLSMRIDEEPVQTAILKWICTIVSF